MRISATDGPARRSTSLRCRVAPPEVRSSVLDKMRNLLRTSLLIFLLAEATRLPAQQVGAPVTIRAAQVINGRGGVQRNVVVTVRGSKIERVGAGAGKVSYDLGSMTLLPGFIDTHVHIGWHFDTNERWVGGGEAPDQAALYGAENAYVTLMAGFTTVQSVGAPSDKPLRDAIARGVLPGPRILTSLDQMTDARLTPQQLREYVRKKKSEGADLIKIFASLSIREGGAPTLSQEQLNAACGEARDQGLRAMIHAQSAESMIRAARARCTAVEHWRAGDRRSPDCARSERRLVRSQHRTQLSKLFR